MGSVGDCDSALTPQSSRRLEGLAESVRDEFVAMRDVYLGGSCIVSTIFLYLTRVPTSGAGGSMTLNFNCDTAQGP